MKCIGQATRLKLAAASMFFNFGNMYGSTNERMKPKTYVKPIRERPISHHAEICATKRIPEFTAGFGIYQGFLQLGKMLLVRKFRSNNFPEFCRGFCSRRSDATVSLKTCARQTSTAYQTSTRTLLRLNAGELTLSWRCRICCS